MTVRLTSVPDMRSCQVTEDGLVQVTMIVSMLDMCSMCSARPRHTSSSSSEPVSQVTQCSIPVLAPSTTDSTQIHIGPSDEPDIPGYPYRVLCSSSPATRASQRRSRSEKLTVLLLVPMTTHICILAFDLSELDGSISWTPIDGASGRTPGTRGLSCCPGSGPFV